MEDFTYSGNPNSNKRDAVRYLVGDTNKDDALLSDSEIDYELANEGQPFIAAANCCIVISIKLSRQINRTPKTLDLSRGQHAGLHELWIARADALRARAASHIGPIFASDCIAQEVASDMYPHIFDIGMHDNKFIP